MDGSHEPLTLAKQHGIYRERAAPPALVRHVECLWSHQMPAGPRAPIAVVPDGCVDILWSDRGLVVAGPDRVAAFPVIAAGAKVVGLRFRPGVAASFMRTSLSEIVGEIVRQLEERQGNARGHDSTSKVAVAPGASKGKRQ